MELKGFLKTVADEQVERIICNGQATPGNNGPYHCVDTPVRNSAHWCVTYNYLYDQYGEKRYQDLAFLLGQVISKEQKKSASGSVKCMLDDRFDDINGLIGQAWAIEGLLAAFEATGDKTFLDVSRDLFFSQPFREEDAFWERKDTKGNVIGYDHVFNHQLWFAAAGALLNNKINDNEIDKRISGFLEGTSRHFLIHKDGRIKHFGDYKKKTGVTRKAKRIVASLLPHFVWVHDPDRFHMSTYEDAYQLFNLYGLAVLFNNGYSDNSLFESDSFKKALSYGMDIERLNKSFNVDYLQNISRNEGYTISRFAYPYNSPAFEYGYVSATFTGKQEYKKVIELMKIQNYFCFNEDDKMYDRNTEDKETLTARVYELTRYLELLDE